MKKRMIYILWIVFFCSQGYAQESMFGFTKVDFFKADEPIIKQGSVQKYTQLENPPNTQKTETENIWSEPIVGPGGKIVYYTPPKQVVEFLDNPSMENAKEYLQWNMGRLDKIHQAQAMLKQVTFQMGMLPREDVLKHKKINRLPKNVAKRWVAGQNYIAFFLLKGCPYCEQQKETISKLKEKHPDLRIEVFVKGYSHEEIKRLPFKAVLDQGISQSLGFSRYPTTLMVNEYGKKVLVPGVLSDSLIYDFFKGRS